MLSDGEFGQRRESAEAPVVPCRDRALVEAPSKYADFAARLGRAKMLRCSTNAHDPLAPLSVRKKSGHLRIVWDRRAVDTPLAKCPNMNMSSGSKLADLEFDSGEEVFTAQADVANYLCHFAISEELSESFALEWW
eukprot:1923226-Pyramimonas_sp.AAC.1